MKNEDLTIVVVSTDSYSDLWDNFFHCLKVYWPDCPYDIILVNNSKEVNIEGIKIFHNTISSQWSERTRCALNQINTKYICFMLEDFFVSDFVDNKNFENAIRLMNGDNIKYYKLLSLTEFISPKYNSFNYLHEITESYPYGISLMPAIWDREFFLEKIGNGNYNPWKFETDRLKEEEIALNSNKIIGVYDNRNILNITHMVVQGKYLPPSIRTLKKKGFSFDEDYRDTMSYADFKLYMIKTFLVVKMRKYPFLKKMLYPFKKFSVSEKYKS